MKKINKYNVGDRVLVNPDRTNEGVMTDYMVEQYGGKTFTINKVYERSFGAVYSLAGLCGYLFAECDLCSAEEKLRISVPGGHLYAEAYGGGDYPAIHIYFVASGDTVEHDLCFAEVCAMDNPDVIRVGTYFHEGDDVKEIFEYPMWKKEDAHV